MEGKRTAYTLTQKIIFIQEFEKSGATQSSISDLYYELNSFVDFLGILLDTFSVL